MGELEAVHMEERVHRDVQLTALLGIPEAVEHLPALAAGNYQPRALELLLVVGHRRAGHCPKGAQTAPAPPAVAE